MVKVAWVRTAPLVEVRGHGWLDQLRVKDEVCLGCGSIVSIRYFLTAFIFVVVGGYGLFSNLVSAVKDNVFPIIGQ